MLFLASQIMFWIVLSFLFGLGIGWWISGAMMLDLGSTQIGFKKEGKDAPSGSISVLSESLLKTQRELEACQQSLVQAEARLKELDMRYEKKPPARPAPRPVPAGNAHADRDDLTLIHGIGPVIERKLAELNITTYRQIANLTPEEIQRISRFLDYFPGRIERDGWITSARELHRRKYGEEI